MASSVPSCGVCEYRHIFKPASIWCSDCNEGLCVNCNGHHEMSKATRKHRTISMSDYQKLPSYIRNINQTCSEHDESYQIYCNDHECACCSKCIVEKHAKCQNIANFDDVVKHTKSSIAFIEIQETLNEVAENIERIHKDKKNNMKAISKKRKRIESEIQQVRENINQYLDKLRDNFLIELNDIERKENKKINQFINALDEHICKISEHQKKITHIKQYASDLQSFLAMKQLEGDVDEKFQFIDSLSESGVLNRVEIKCNISSSLTDIANIVSVFGKVYIESASKSVMITKKKQQQAQLVLHRALSVPVDTIQVELQQTIENKSHVRGCCILPEGKCVLTYPDLNKVEIVKEDGSVDFSLNVTAAYGVAYNDADNTLAISSWWFNGVGAHITIIDLTQRKVKKTFSLGGQTTGIATTNKTLLFYKTNKAIQVIDLSNESTSEIVPKNKESFVDVTICNDRIYYSSYEYDTVVCCDLKGTPIWTFKNESVLSYPSGISADKDGNVFVVGHGTQNVVVISSDGRTHKELLTISENFIRSPWSINFGRATNQLLVATYHKKSYLFTVSRN